MINYKYRKNAERNERILKLYDAHPHTAKFGFAWHEYHKGSIRWIAREMGLSVSCVSGVVYRRNKKLEKGKAAVPIKEP